MTAPPTIPCETPSLESVLAQLERELEVLRAHDRAKAPQFIELLDVTWEIRDESEGAVSTETQEHETVRVTQ